MSSMIIHPTTHLFIYLLNHPSIHLYIRLYTHLRNNYYILGIHRRAEILAVGEKKTTPPSHDAYIFVGADRQETK